jgi:hypothetical protein
MHHLGPKRRANELTTAITRLTSLARQPLQHLRDRRAILRIEVGVDFVEEVEGRGIALLDREDECQCAERLLAARELGDALLLVVLGVEGHGDGDAGVFDDFAAFLGLCLFFVFAVAVVVVGAATCIGVGAAVDDEAALADGHELLEDFTKGDSDLAEGTCDGFVLALVEVVDQVANVLA